MLECVTGAENHCSLGLRVIQTCEDCGLEKSKVDRNQWGMLLGDGSVEGKML